jgi:hypothetical protein
MNPRVRAISGRGRTSSAEPLSAPRCSVDVRYRVRPAIVCLPGSPARRVARPSPKGPGSKNKALRAYAMRIRVTVH